jgi:hypothetical protein
VYHPPPAHAKGKNAKHAGDVSAELVFAGPVYRTENTHRTELD